ncbi:MAG: GAF domain-containing protein [Actinobacteria bacterium]|nr:GAF domain-containing protein [Actinomycetota bacterium]
MRVDSALRDLIEEVCAADVSEDELYDRAVESIIDAAPHYNWVGIYKVDGDELVLNAWRGPEETEHVRIPISEGICGFAATEGETVVVDDVNADPRYLACFPQTRSEIVVPILANGEVVAEIDIDSDTKAAFKEADVQLLEEVAEMIGKKVAELSE